MNQQLIIQFIKTAILHDFLCDSLQENYLFDECLIWKNMLKNVDRSTCRRSSVQCITVAAWTAAQTPQILLSQWRRCHKEPGRVQVHSPRVKDHRRSSRSTLTHDNRICSVLFLQKLNVYAV